MGFLKMVGQTACGLFLLLAGIGATHLLGFAGLTVGGPLCALGGYFVGITLMVSALVWANENLA